MGTFLIPVAVVLAVQTVPAAAQSVPASPTDSTNLQQLPDTQTSTAVLGQARIVRAQVARSANDGNARDGFTVSGIALRADTDSTDVSLTLSSARDNQTTFGETNKSLTFKAPIDTATKEGFLLTRDGVPGGFGVELSLSGLTGSYQPLEYDTVPNKMYKIAHDRCVKAGVDRDLDIGARNEKCGSGPVGFSTWGLQYLSEAEKIEYQRAMRTDSRGLISQSLVFWNLTAATSVLDFDFSDPTSFQKSSQRKVGYSLSGSIGYSPRSGAVFFVGSAEYRQAWQAPKDRIRCPATAGGAPVDCVQGAFGPPEKNIDYKISGLVRAAEIFGPKLPISVELKASYDAKDNVVGFEFPIYAFIDNERKLRGGVRVGWDSGEKDVRFGVFVGAPFSLLAF